MAVPWVITTVTAPLGTPRANAFRVAIMARFPGQLVSWGTYSCRKQTDGPNWSAHSWGNADDIHPLSAAIGDKAVAWTLANAAAFGVDTSQVLWRGIPGHYPGHFHVAFLPNLESGGATPPCAGGPAVTISGDAVSTIALSDKGKIAGSGGAVPEVSPGVCPKGYVPIGKGLCLPTPGLNLKTTQGAAADLAGKVAGGIFGGFAHDLPSYLKIAAGGVVMLAGLAAVIVSATGTPLPGPVGALAGQTGQTVGRAQKLAQARSQGREAGILAAREDAARRDAKEYEGTEPPEPTAAERRRGNIRSTARVRAA